MRIGQDNTDKSVGRWWAVSRFETLKGQPPFNKNKAAQRGLTSQEDFKVILRGALGTNSFSYAFVSLWLNIMSKDSHDQ
jgi:hypothetical protein